MQVDPLAAAGRGAVELPRLEPRGRALHGLAMRSHPGGDGLEPLDLLGREGARSRGADVEEQVPAPTGDLADGVHELARRLVVGIVGHVAPALVHRHARLPPSPRRGRRDELLGGRVVARAREAVVDEDVGLERADHGLELLGPPPVGRALPGAVEPQQVDGAVVRQQLADPAEHESEVALPRLGTGRGRRLPEGVGLVGLGQRRIVRVVPVGQREVDAHAESGGPHRLDELADDVAAVGSLGDREVRQLGVEHGEAGVVLGGDDRVAHTRGAGESGEGARVPLLRVEGCRRRLVLVDRDGSGRREGEDSPGHGPRHLEPLLAGMVPVHEHPQSSLVEPLTAHEPRD